MDELLDILDEFGNPTGTTALKSEAHRLGLYHATVHIWIYNAEGQVLLQQRGFDKKTYPGYWDVSVAGHIGAGESVLEGAVREVAEEIGLTVQPNRLFKIATRKGQRKHPNGIIDNEFYNIFLLQLTKDFNTLTKQDEEIAAIQMFDLDILSAPNSAIPLVPNPNEHYLFIRQSILNQLQP